MPKFDIIALDADDTLWQNERYYRETEAAFIQLMAPFGNSESVSTQLLNTESRNIKYFGYGVKSFTLSMIETALTITNGSFPPANIQTLLELAKNIIKADVELLDHVSETIADLSNKYRLMVITKGDLLHQESKIARSELAHHFLHTEIVSTKTPQSYAGLLQNHSIDPHRFLMVGNSLRSDILPILALGGHAVYIPHNSTWAHEIAEVPVAGTHGFYEIEHIGHLPALIEEIEKVP